MKYLMILFLAGTATFAAPISPAEKAQVIASIAAKLRPVMGEKWGTLRTRWEPRLEAAKDEQAFYRALNEMLKDTKKSHFVMISPKEKDLIESNGDPSGNIGLVVRLIDGRVVITAVQPGLPAAEAGVEPGFVIEKLNGLDLIEWAKELAANEPDSHRQQVTLKSRASRWFAGKPNSSIQLTLRDHDDKVSEKTLTRVQTGKTAKWGHLPAVTMAFGAERLADDEIGYIRFNIFMMPLLLPIKKAIMRFRDCRGIILDLRGNPGGLGMMAQPIAGMFTRKRISLGITKSGDDELRFPVFPNRKAYHGPLLILTDEMTASTSEILAGGLQEAGLAKTVGFRTMGAVLPSLMIQLPNGSQIQYPIGDFKTPKGNELEGKGVLPDYPIVVDRKKLRASGDLVLKQAISILHKNEKDTP